MIIWCCMILLTTITLEYCIKLRCSINMNCIGRQKGFTLIELMVAITLLAILLTIGLPSFRALIQNNRITAQTNAFISAHTYARSEAVKRSSRVDVCPRNLAGTACSGNDWNSGWLVLIHNGAVLRVWDAPQAGITVTLDSGNTQRVSYLNRGEVDVARDFWIRAQDCTGEQQRNVSINTIGRITTTRVACN